MEAGKKVISLFAASVEALYVPFPVLQEVTKLSEAEARKLGLEVIDTEIDVLEKASQIKTGCSFKDNVCYLTAKAEGLICATNDKKLRKVCEADGVETFWGLQIMIFLVQEGKLSKKEAVEIARKIHGINSNITKDLLIYFGKIINDL